VPIHPDVAAFREEHAAKGHPDSGPDQRFCDPCGMWLVDFDTTELTLLRDLARATDRWFEAIVSTATTEEADMATRLLTYRRFIAARPTVQAGGA
jgi:hypothetical protein